MKWTLFDRLNKPNIEPAISLKVENILNELHQFSNIASQARTESILLEELRQQCNTASQIRSEVSNMLYFFLIGVTILAAVILGLLTLYDQYNGKAVNVIHTTLQFFLMGTLVFFGIVCIMFIRRFVELTTEQSQYIESINALKSFFAEKLEVQGISKKLLYIPDNLDDLKRIPTYIRYIVIPIGCFSFSAATYILTGFISFQLALRLSFFDIWAFAITSSISVCVFVICFFLLDQRYMVVPKVKTILTQK